ncbi:uncharacterized protein YaaQ [Caldalkalibacillus uzonensis]|uniref:Uncharacterized protein YaaQ n=1 Tax=Caldalkalibacillus uzonensis TaxID=353224 RepID=A0ABU0CUD3_9BACI|nr:cyclic-di-AMP receptor [Caldalkalibacillus uzonensis]MDQ0340030.1 uncharacterized protein YaaQ [Caldalkalibacillus uzonensis]
MKVIICIIDQRYGSKVIQQLVDGKYKATHLASTGNFLKQGNDTLILGVKDQEVQKVRGKIKSVIDRINREKGWKIHQYRCTLFVLDMHHLSVFGGINIDK